MRKEEKQERHYDIIVTVKAHLFELIFDSISNTTMSSVIQVKFTLLFLIFITLGIIWIIKISEGEPAKNKEDAISEKAASERRQAIIDRLNGSEVMAVPEVTLDYLVGRTECTNKSDLFPEERLSVMMEISAFLEDASILERTENCDKYFEVVSTHAFDDVTEEERGFPLAFSHTGKGPAE